VEVGGVVGFEDAVAVDVAEGVEEFEADGRKKLVGRGGGKGGMGRDGLGYEDLDPGLVTVCWDGGILEVDVVCVGGVWNLAAEEIFEFRHVLRGWLGDGRMC
jgi:hypothetical protein